MPENTSGKPPADAKPSAVEVAKSESNYLAGDIPDELIDGAPGFGKAAIQLLKNHGTYQQADRDKKKLQPGEKRVKKISFMIRTRIPGGKLTAEQMLAQIDLGDDLANGSVRLTTRQGIQHHGVIKGDLKAYIQKINEIQLTTLAACGDVERNVMCCPAPIRNNTVRDQMMAKAEELAEALAPRTTAYHEIWLTDDERWCSCCRRIKKRLLCGRQVRKRPNTSGKKAIRDSDRTHRSCSRRSLRC